MFEQFHFIRPYFLLLLLVTAWFCWYLYKKSKNSNAWSDVCDPKLLSYLLVGSDKKTGLMPVWLALIVGILLSVALAGPTWTKLPQAVYKKEAARVFVLDLSRSMDATDVTPSRASRAKLKLIDLLTASEEGQAALIVYAADPHVVSPLTDDADTIIAMIPSLSPAIMPAQGSRTDRAIIKAAQLLTQAGNYNGEIVLMSDGANGASAIDAAQKISAGGYTLHVVGVGTAQGSPIPMRSGGFLKDKAGAIVIPKVDRSGLQELALAGSGRYVDLAVDDADVRLLIRDTINDNLETDNPLTREVDLWQDEGHWFLLLALPFVAMGFRRGWLTVVVFSVCYMPQGELYAFDWQDLWQTKDQQASKMLNAGDAEQAAEMYQNPNWKGAAHYKNGNFEQAVDAFSQTESIQANYNRANALAKQGNLEDAIEAYDQVLQNQPNHEDAKFNKDLVKSVLDQQKQKPAGDEKQESDDGEEKSDQQQESEQQESSSDQSDSQQDQQQSEQQSDSGQESENEEQESEQQQQQAEQNEEDKAEEEKEQSVAQQQEENKENEQEQNPEQTEQENKEQKEIQQATQQWLRRIPDDPGGLLREKFSRQHQRQQRRKQTENPW